MTDRSPALCHLTRPAQLKATPPGRDVSPDKRQSDAGNLPRSVLCPLRRRAKLAAIAGAAALASVAGRIPAAILTLSAAGLAAGNQFLGSGVRYERNRKRRNAWKALELDACLEKAKLEEPPRRRLEEVMRPLLDRRAAIDDMDHEPVPLIALGRQVWAPERSGHASPKAAE